MFYSSIAYSLIIDAERKTRSKKEREKVRYGGIKKERDDSVREIKSEGERNVREIER